MSAVKVGGQQLRSASTALGMLGLVPARDLSANEGAGAILGGHEACRGGGEARKALETGVGAGAQVRRVQLSKQVRD